MASDHDFCAPFVVTGGPSVHNLWLSYSYRAFLGEDRLGPHHPDAQRRPRDEVVRRHPVTFRLIISTARGDELSLLVQVEGLIAFSPDHKQCWVMATVLEITEPRIDLRETIGGIVLVAHYNTANREGLAQLYMGGEFAGGLIDLFANKPAQLQLRPSESGRDRIERLLGVKWNPTTRKYEPAPEKG